MDNRSNSRANTCKKPGLLEQAYLLDIQTNRFGDLWWLIITSRIAFSDDSFKFLPYQLLMVGYWPTMALTGNGELGFDSGEGAWETATTSKEGSRRVNYPIVTHGGSDNKYQSGALRVLHLEWVQFKSLNEDPLEGKSGASSRGNSSSNSVYLSCCS